MDRRVNLLAGGVAALALAGASGAIAATELSSSPSRGDSAVISEAAAELGVSSSALSSALLKASDNRINSEVTAGKLTQAQASLLESALSSGRIPLLGPLVGAFGPGGFKLGRGGGPGRKSFGPTGPSGLKGSGRPPAGPWSFGPTGPSGPGSKGFGPTGPSGPAGPLVLGAGSGGGLAAGLAAAESYLGLTGSQLVADLEGGKTLGQIALAQGKTASGLVEALVSAEKSKLASAVSAGKLSSTQAKAIEPKLQEWINDLVEGSALKRALGLAGVVGRMRGLGPVPGGAGPFPGGVSPKGFGPTGPGGPHGGAWRSRPTGPEGPQPLFGIPRSSSRTARHR